MVLKYILFILFFISAFMLIEFVVDLVVCYYKVKKIEIKKDRKQMLIFSLAYIITFFILGV